MVRRRKILSWFVTVVIVFLATLGINKLVHATIHKMKDKPVQSEETEEVVSSKYPNLELKIETKEADTYRIFVHKPITEGTNINTSIDKWINNQRNTFLEEMEERETGLKEKAIQGELNVQVETKKITDELYSLVFRVYTYTGGANGQQIMKVFNVDIGRDKSLKLSNVIEIDEESLPEIQELVKEELQKKEEVKPFIFDDLLDEILKQPAKWKWSLDRKALTLYFDEYEIAAGAAGTIELEIPIEKLYVYLNDDIDSILKMPKEQQKEKEKIIQKEHEKREELDPDGKYIALTFDDGPSEKVTPGVLKTLEKYDAKATFFMLGSQADHYPELAYEVASAGHEIGNHSRGHPVLPNLNKEGIKDELDYTHEKLKEVTGVSPGLIRPPYGAFNSDVVEYAIDHNTQIAMWSIDSLDWKSRDAKSIEKIVLNEATPNAIVLMHDIHSSTADALPKILKKLKEEGYEFVTVSQLLKLKEENDVGPYYGEV
ncbi:polysaccharide deacetylase family protein [Virgibacillus alimentarius]|uniref:polysaccharide deacetylase family protein n=1 Tax=Virgibacillus alimentarius TaxID=698769 RepID=UPI001CF729EA|nr:polysaccharide deacetylase family protein [Virgibacillus alimentarius]